MKNIGIGTDIEDIGRFRKFNLVKDNAFLNKIFTKVELDYCFSKLNPAPHLAVRYAGKEAIVKALSSVSKEMLDYRDIEILNNARGVPIAKINDEKFLYMEINITLSHTKEIAIAFVLVKKLILNL